MPLRYALFFVWMFPKNEGNAALTILHHGKLCEIEKINYLSHTKKF